MSSGCTLAELLLVIRIPHSDHLISRAAGQNFAKPLAGTPFPSHSLLKICSKRQQTRKIRCNSTVWPGESSGESGEESSWRRKVFGMKPKEPGSTKAPGNGDALDAEWQVTCSALTVICRFSQLAFLTTHRAQYLQERNIIRWPQNVLIGRRGRKHDI